MRKISSLAILFLAVILMGHAAFAEGDTPKAESTAQVTIVGPNGTKVFMDGRLIGTTGPTQTLVIKAPDVVVGHKYALKIVGSLGEKTVSFVAREGNGVVQYGTPPHTRGISVTSKDYKIVLPEK